MAVTTEYLSGERIQGRSDDTVDISPTYTQLFENASDSSLTGNNNTGGSSYFNVDSTVADALYFDPRRSSSIFGQTWDLGSSLSETSWVLRAKVNVTSLDTTGDTVRIFIGMNNQNSTVGASHGSNKFIGSASFVNSDGQQWYRVSVKGNTLDVGEANQLQIVTGTLYIEIIRKTETTYSVRWTTSSDFTGGTLVDDQTVGGNGGSGSTSSMALRYFWLSNINVNGNQDAHFQGNVEYVKIWNGVTTTTTAKDKSTITDVPTGTRYEETDTRKIFRRKLTPTATVFSHLNSSDQGQVNNVTTSEDTRMGQEFQAGHTNIGDSFDKVTIRLRNIFSDSATYAITMKVWNGSTVKATSPTVVTLDDLEQGLTWDSSAPYDDEVVFYFTTPVTIAAGDIIGVEPQGGTFNVSSIGFRYQSSGSVSNTRVNSWRNGAWGGNVGLYNNDAYMILELQESESWVEKGTA